MDLYDVSGGLPRRRRLPPPSGGELGSCLILVGSILFGLVVLIICCGVL